MLSNETNDAVVVLTTAGSEAEASNIARALVERKLAACVNLVPGVRSIYAWQGEICDDSEVLLVSKTTRARFDALAAAIRELHSYNVPEIVALSASEVDDAYAAWLTEAVR
ncbi:MAG: divalent-cation tolerance protein CutA [Candidatus Binatia bacterium]|nr:divalent-cation tolerance protein CutA [Candidatus Binatia bacterium]